MFRMWYSNLILVRAVACVLVCIIGVVVYVCILNSACSVLVSRFDSERQRHCLLF